MRGEARCLKLMVRGGFLRKRHLRPDLKEVRGEPRAIWDLSLLSGKLASAQAASVCRHHGMCGALDREQELWNTESARERRAISKIKK